MGNSEVGHTNLGAGRIVYQDLVRINRAVEDGSFFKNEALISAARTAKEAGGALHLMGLVSDGGVHSHVEHLHACLELARREGVARAYVHAFMDGRDTPPKSGVDYMRQVEQKLAATGYGKVASVCGRYYAMDRDKRWDRVSLAYAGMVKGEGRQVASGVDAMEQAYAAGETDEFVKPSVVVEDGKPIGADPRRRRGALLQLPLRPGPRDHHGGGRPGLQGLRPRHAPEALDLRLPDPVRADLPLPHRLRAAGPDADLRRAGLQRRPGASSASPRPRSTPTSPSSSTAGGRRSSRTRTGSWSPRRAT